MLLVSLISRGFDSEQVSIFALQLDRVLSSVLPLVPHFRMPLVYLLEALPSSLHAHLIFYTLYHDTLSPGNENGKENSGWE